MKFRIVPSTRDGRQQLLTTYLINDTLAIDAGAIAIGLSRAEQLRIRSVVITHAHLDHMISLPLFITDLFDEWRQPVKVYATAADFAALRQHIFNPRIWVGLETLQNAHTRLIEHHPIQAKQSFTAEDLRLTPIPVTHAVLTHGLLVEDERSALLFTSDTGATEELWQAARDCAHLRAVFIDLSYPRRLAELAHVSGHHSPLTLLEELPKIKPCVPVYAVHLKPAYRAQIEAEIAALSEPRLRIAEVGREYEF